MKTTIFLTLLFSTASGNSVIQKVVDLLKKSESKLNGECKQDVVNQQENAVKINRHRGRLGAEITGTQNLMDKFSADVASASSGLQNAKAAVEDAFPEQAAVEEEKKAAKQQREESKAVYEAARDELTESLTMLQKAIQVLERVLKPSLLQTPRSKAIQKDMRQVTDVLGLILNSVAISSMDRSKLSSFLQEHKVITAQTDDDSDDAFLQAPPQAATQSYTSKSGAIVDMVKQLKTQAEGELQALNQGESQARQAYALLNQDLNNEIKSLQNTIATNKDAIDEHTKEKATAQKNLDQEKNANGDAKQSLDKLNSRVRLMDKKFQARQTECTKQLQGLNTAIDILGNKFGSSFLQMSMSNTMSTKEKDERTKIAGVLQESATKFRDLKLAELAQRLKDGTGMDKVVNMVKDMVARLQKQAAEAAEKQARCKKELGETNAKIDALTSKKDKNKSRVDKNDARKQEVSDAIKETQDAINENDAAIRDNKADYSKQVPQRDAAIAESKETIEALEGALEALREAGFGAGASFLQVSAEQKSKAGDFDFAEQTLSDQGDAASGPVGILMTELDNTRELYDGQKSDLLTFKDASKTESQELKVEAAKLASSLTGFKAELKSVASNTHNYAEDLSGTQQELAAAEEYLQKLKPGCTVVPKTYAERKAEREQKIANLKDALVVLQDISGSSFLQKAQRGLRD